MRDSEQAQSRPPDPQPPPLAIWRPLPRHALPAPAPPPDPLPDAHARMAPGPEGGALATAALARRRPDTHTPPPRPSPLALQMAARPSACAASQADEAQGLAHLARARPRETPRHAFLRGPEGSVLASRGAVCVCAAGHELPAPPHAHAHAHAHALAGRAPAPVARPARRAPRLARHGRPAHGRRQRAGLREQSWRGGLPRAGRALWRRQRSLRTREPGAGLQAPHRLRGRAGLRPHVTRHSSPRILVQRHGPGAERGGACASPAMARARRHTPAMQPRPCRGTRGRGADGAASCPSAGLAS